MRPIKFRAWDRWHKEMFSPHMNGWTLKQLTEGQVENASGSYNSYPIMQFTGLQDKNGKEIYEGDVLRRLDEALRVDNLFPVHRGTHVTNIGYWEGRKYHYRSNPASRYDNIDDWMSFPEYYEVIGNIYENPELIKHS